MLALASRTNSSSSSSAPSPSELLPGRCATDLASCSSASYKCAICSSTFGGTSFPVVSSIIRNSFTLSSFLSINSLSFPNVKYPSNPPASARFALTAGPAFIFSYPFKSDEIIEIASSYKLKRSRNLVSFESPILVFSNSCIRSAILMRLLCSSLLSTEISRERKCTMDILAPSDVWPT